MDSSLEITTILTNKIKAKALELGFAACGIAIAQELSDEIGYLENWLHQGFQAEMTYMQRNIEKRLNPTLLEEGTKSIIVVLIPYPSILQQKADSPKIARYAQTIDYHEPIRKKLYELYGYIKETTGDETLRGRAFTDSAPILERAWAIRAGLGWQGKNGLLINKKLGSYFLIGELLINIPLIADKPFTQSFCGQCTRCIQACPSQAIVKKYTVNARLCLSYRTIEQKNTPEVTTESLHGRLFGCDICQEVCPWNVKPKLVSPDWLPLLDAKFPQSVTEWKALNENDFKQQFSQSALLRTGYPRLMHNLDLL